MNWSSACRRKSIRSHRRKELSGLLDELKLVWCHLRTIYIATFLEGKEALSLESMGKKIPCIVATCPYSIGRANRASVSPRSSSSSSSSRCGNVRSQEGADNRYILLTVDAAACSLLSRSLHCEIGDSTQFDSLLLHSEGVVSNASEDLKFWYFCFLTLSFDFIDSQFAWG